MGRDSRSGSGSGVSQLALISCFSVFNLESRRADEDKDAVKKCLQKLSQAFKVKLATLQQQYVALLPIAEALHKEGSFQNRAAWVEAFARAQQRRAARREDCEALLQVLSAFLAWSASTPGVEQTQKKSRRTGFRVRGHGLLAG